jgi:anaerobic magnesium-protoporphyrin IX monomethyl ester cyclase
MCDLGLVPASRSSWKNFVGIYPYQKRPGVTYDDLHPPLGIEYVAQAAKGLVENVTVVDMRYENGALGSFLKRADIVGISILWPHQRDIALKVIGRIPNRALVVLGGIQPTQYPGDYMDSCPRVDIVVRGDGEETIREILTGRPLQDVRGISFRQDGKIVHNPPRPVAPICDSYPDRRLRSYRYDYHLFPGLNLGMDCILSSRGCSFGCEYCTFRLDSAGQKRPWSGRSAESVVEEIASIPKDFILFSDDDFGQNVSRVEKICDLIIARRIKKEFGCEMRVDIARRPDILRKMRRAGFWVLSFGIESCQDKTLRRINKNLTVRKIEESFRILRKYDLFYIGYFIIGYVGESVREILEIPNFARRLGLDFIAPSVLRAYPHSLLRERLEHDPNYRIGNDHVVLNRKMRRDDLSWLHHVVVRKFYTPGQIVRILKKFLFGGIPKLFFLKFIFAAFLCELPGRRLGLRMGSLR